MRVAAALAGVLATLGVLTPASAAEAAEKPAAPGKHPNVILIVTDDQTLDSYVPDVMPHT